MPPVVPEPAWPPERLARLVSTVRSTMILWTELAGPVQVTVDGELAVVSWADPRGGVCACLAPPSWTDLAIAGFILEKARGRGRAAV